MNARQRRERDQEADFIAKHYNQPTCSEPGCENTTMLHLDVCAMHPKSGALPPEHYYGGPPMPEAQLPTTELAARPMFAPLDSSLIGLLERYVEMKTKPLTRMVVESAKELDTDAKAFIAGAEASEAKKAVESAFKVHRFLSGMFKKATDPAQEIRRFCSGVLARWES